jgi:hypothetical protein
LLVLAPARPPGFRVRATYSKFSLNREVTEKSNFAR